MAIETAQRACDSCDDGLVRLARRGRGVRRERVPKQPTKHVQMLVVGGPDDCKLAHEQVDHGIGQCLERTGGCLEGLEVPLELTNTRIQIRFIQLVVAIGRDQGNHPRLAKEASNHVARAFRVGRVHRRDILDRRLGKQCVVS